MTVEIKWEYVPVGVGRSARNSQSGISGSLFITIKSVIILENTGVKTNQATSRLDLAIGRRIKFWVDQLPPFHKKYASKKSKSNLGSDTTVDY